MLHRLLVILLMQAVTVSGFAVPHSHGSIAGTQPDDHNQTPHLHLGGHHHHHGHSPPSQFPESQKCEQDSSTPKSPTQPSNHDDDALYVSGELGLNLTQTVQSVDDSGVVIWNEAVPPSPARLGRFCESSLFCPW